MIRVKALVVIARPGDGALLVFEGDDDHGGYARPLGGSVEFGELAADAAAREIEEELGCGLTSVGLLGVLENRFVLAGREGHEIDFVFRAEPTDPTLYRRDSIPILDCPDVHAVWWSPTTHASRLVPAGLTELLA